MKVGEVFLNTKKTLQASNIESFSIDALILISFVSGFCKEEIIFSDKELNANQLSLLEECLKRRCNKEPISHIINHREFYGLDFFVDKNVLDPRPDSEILVEMAIEKIDNKNVKILEIGVGSGCLSIAILKNCKNSSAFGVDLSKNALEICNKNIKSHKLEDRFKTNLSDLFNQIPKQKFDVIISNPPYIKTSDIEKLQDEVKIHEPRSALDGGEDGLEFYRQIAKNAPEFLNKNGLIIVEIGFDQKNEVIDIFLTQNFKLDQAKKDLALRDRALAFIYC